MSNVQKVFPYLLITPHQDVGMSAGALAEGGLYQTDDGHLYSFLSTKSFADVHAELAKVGKEYVLVLAEKYGYANAGGQLARVFDHIK
ncbi:hypothetical protein ASC74_18825 [Pseudomonas sp. Root329]|uniref:hypothetical protein n=1 Tax=Pseudomonas sp. Root329 TaxID=1736515 RepID=UPI000713F129|nr:hypothetical protein [Pseudomonas sp. Root329]KQV21109.1 hypothetical protein ASC74_18825 [Pseudomonas sp. Root329]